MFLVKILNDEREAFGGQRPYPPELVSSSSALLSSYVLVWELLSLTSEIAANFGPGYLARGWKTKR